MQRITRSIPSSGLVTRLSRFSLVSGQIVARFEPKVTPDSPEVTAAIEKALAAEKH